MLKVSSYSKVKKEQAIRGNRSKTTGLQFEWSDNRIFANYLEMGVERRAEVAIVESDLSLRFTATHDNNLDKAGINRGRVIRFFETSANKYTGGFLHSLNLVDHEIAMVNQLQDMLSAGVFNLEIAGLGLDEEIQSLEDATVGILLEYSGTAARVSTKTKLNKQLERIPEDKISQVKEFLMTKILPSLPALHSEYLSIHQQMLSSAATVASLPESNA